MLTKSVQHAPFSDGIAVLSEFVGCAHVLNGAIRVNPFNLEDVVEQLDLTLGTVGRTPTLPLLRP